MSQISKLIDYGTATLYDAARRLKLETGLSSLSPLLPGSRFAAPAFTVKFSPIEHAPAEPLNLYDIIDSIPKGHAMVVELGADRWTFGANIMHFAQLSGLAGVVIDGGARDVATIRERGFPVFARGASVIGSSSSFALNSFGTDIRCAGVTVATNDIIVADDDGVISLPATHLDQIVYQAEEIAQLDAALARGIETKRPLSELHETRLRWGVRRAPPDKTI